MQESKDSEVRGLATSLADCIAATKQPAQQQTETTAAKSATATTTASDSKDSAVSGSQSKQQVDREAFLASVLNNLEKLLCLPMSDVMKQYLTHDILLGKEVTVMPKKREDKSSYYTA